MPYTAQTTIRGPSASSPDDFCALVESHGAKRLHDVDEYIHEVYRLCEPAGIRAELVIVQAIHETDWFRSYWWVNRLNPAGIGITGDPAQNDASRNFESGAIAARAHVVHLALYTFGTDLPANLKPYQHEDPRWQAAIDAGYAGVCHTIGDLTNTWAADDQYATKLVRHLTGIVGGTPEGSVVTRPYIILVAGHRSTGDPGNPTERSRTDEMARAYTDAFRDAGYRADWWQRDLDNDGDPDMTIGNLTTVAVGVRNAIIAAPEELVVMLDLHYDGGHSVVHTIVPDNVGLRSAVSGGDVLSDTAANNTLDVALAQKISQNIVYATGLGIYGGPRLGKLGVMSERDTGVALSGNWRLGMFAATAQQRMKAVRLVVEHAGWADSATLEAGFEERCADAAVDAVNAVLDIEPPIVKPEEPDEPEGPETPVLDYPAGIDRGIATRLFDQATGDDERIYGFNERGPVSNLWLSIGVQTGQFPALTDVWRYDDADDHWRKYFRFSNGLVILDTDTSGLSIIGGPQSLIAALDNVLNGDITIDNSK